MRARTIGAVLAAAAIAASIAPSAGAAVRLTRVGLRSSGSVKVVWHGDRARGCAAAGLCGYSGSISYSLRHGKGFIERAPSGPGSFVDYFGFLESPGPIAVRTERAVPGRDPAVCSQRSRFHVLTLSFAGAWSDRRWMTLGTDIFPQPMASGQCAGPRVEDFAGSMPSALVRRHTLDRRGARLSLAGRFPFRSGPISGQVVSTVRLKSRGIQHTRLLDDEVEEDEPAGKHELVVELRYRATRISGEVRNDFTAVSAPICRLRDACGAHGSQLYSLDDAARTVTVTGFAPTRSRHRPSLRRALRKVVRDGFLDASIPIGRDAGLTTHAFVRPSGATCTDRFRPRQPPFLLLFGEEGRLVLSLFRNDASLLRGRCPGPVDGTPGSNQLAHERLTPGRLLKRAVRLRLHGRKEFATGAYRGTRTARLDLRLRRTRARVRVHPSFRESSLSRSGLTAARPRQRP